MAWLFIWLLAILCFSMLVHGFLVRGRFYQYPFLAAGIFFSFILPQLPGLADSRFISETALIKTLFFSCLCLAMCGIGWGVGVRAKDLKDYAFSEQRLLKAAAFLSIVGAYFFYKFGHLPEDIRLKGQLTGLPVAYLFFAKLLTYGFALALICCAKRTSKLALAIIAFDTAFYFERIFIAGRRSETAEFCLLVALAYWFQKRWAVPRIAVVAGLFLAIIGMLGAEDYRKATYYGETRDWSAVINIDLSKNWNRMLEDGGNEMNNAVHSIQYIDESHLFNYGIEHWNDVIFTFVPAQLVGSTIKNALIIPPLNSIHSKYFTPGVGETSTGMADAFSSFWYFGCIKFFLVAFALGRLYTCAMRGNTLTQMIYMLSAVPSMLVITHFTNEIVIAWIHMAIFLTPVLYYTRLPNHRPLATGAASLA